MALPGLTNLGSPGSPASIVDAQEYIWDTSSGGEWIPRIGTSGVATLVVLASGSVVIVEGISISGVNVVVNISGEFVVDVSGDPVSISGALIALASGSIPLPVTTQSGSVVTFTSGSWVATSVSGQPVTLAFPSGLTACRTVYNSGTIVSGACAPLYDFWLESVTVHIDGTAPTISRELVVEAVDGTDSSYNVKILSENPGTNAWTDLLFQPPNPLLQTSGDSVAVSYDNVSGNTIGVKIVTRKFIGTG